MIRLTTLKYYGLILLILPSKNVALGFPLLGKVKNAFAHALSLSTPQTPQIAPALELESWDRPLLHEINQSHIPQEFHLVDIKQENPSITVDMKYTTRDNRTSRLPSSETKCLVAKKVMDKLNKVQAELEGQDLGLKVFDAFRPLYVEEYLSRFDACDPSRKNYSPDLTQEFVLARLMPKYRAQPNDGPLYQNVLTLYDNKWHDMLNIPFSNRGAMVAVTLITKDGTELTMPTKFDDRSEKACSEYQDLPEDIIKNRELLKSVMHKHGFKQAKTWYEFCDSDADTFPRLLYSYYSTASLFYTEEETRVKLVRTINQIIFTHEHRDALLTSYKWDSPLHTLSTLDKLFSIPRKFRLVEIKEHNPKILVDMKYTTAENCAGRPLSAETKCLISRNAMNKLNKVQAELEKKGLGLKVFDAFRPLYVETALARSGKNFTSYPLNDFGLFDYQKTLLFKASMRHRRVVLNSLLEDFERTLSGYRCATTIRNNFLDIPPLIPFSNKGAFVAVTLVTRQGEELAMPTEFDDRSEQAHHAYQDLLRDVRSHKELLKEVMLKHGFKQANTWYEFYDDEVDQYPHLLYTSYTTALELEYGQQADHSAIDMIIHDLTHVPICPCA